MAKRTHDDSDTAVMDEPDTKISTEAAQPARVLTRSEARETFINRCLWNWALEQFMAERGCDPASGHVDKLVEKAGRMFDRCFDKRPITSNLR